MEDEYYRHKVEVLEVVMEEDGQSEPLMITLDGVNYEPLEVTILEKFTETVKATEKLSEKERNSVLDYISDNSDLVSDGLELFINDTDAAVKAHEYLTSIFFDFPSTAELSDVLIQLLLKLLGA
ncbi:TPA: hypothetical protein ACMDPN_003519 [Vibrio cholerae]|uniref:Uncharacterized protein n=2 Tax=Vibrio cholerae TaxID=666 RepID=A0A5B1BWH1_VIBCL|nr:MULTISPECIES: hypothetical protein [Vibrio]EGQ8391450.1 hypothetical protein [Vibrio cholerae]EJK2098794.1 hypothetical protein [Vibrio cholerae]EJX7570147.1 hypothetical protein [Vibrio cholerae]EJY0884972.1 hypothetical protein [Vibrio cholerae]EKF9274094.1 hypothetical protein [Vibrio cholerae]